MEPAETKRASEHLPVKRLHWPTTPTGMSLVGFSQVGLFVIVVCYLIHEMKAVLLPLVLAILVSLIVYPVFLAFRKLRLPRMLSATATVTGVVAILLFGSYQAFLPGAEWLQSVDKEDLAGKVRAAFKPMKEMQEQIKDMAVRVEAVTGDSPAPDTGANGNAGNALANDAGKSAGAKPPAPDEEKLPVDFEPLKKAPFVDSPEVVEVLAPKPAESPVMVEIHEDPVTLLMAETRSFGLGTAAFLLLVLFILAYGNRITRQFSHDERVASMLERMGRDVSHYLSTITIINAALGILIGLAMWGLGMPRPAMWGVMAMVLNFIPYIGALTGTFVIFMAAAVHFEQPGMVLATAAVYFALTAIEGNLVTPAVLGGRFKMNPLVVFVWIFAWAGFWGIAGILIAMPALVIFKIVCENTEKLRTIRGVLES